MERNINLLLEDSPRKIQDSLKILENTFKTSIAKRLKGDHIHEAPLNKLKINIEQLVALNMELKGDNNLLTDVVTKQLEEIQENIMASIQELADSTNSLDKKKVLLANIIPILETSGYAINQFARENMLDSLKSLKIESNITDADAFKELKKEIPVKLTAFEGFDASEFTKKHSSLIIDEGIREVIFGKFQDNIMPLINDGVKKNQAEDVNIGTNMISQNLEQHGVEKALKSNDSDTIDMQISKLPKAYTTLKKMTGQIEYSILNQTKMAYEKHAKLALAEIDSFKETSDDLAMLDHLNGITSPIMEHSEKMALVESGMCTFDDLEIDDFMPRDNLINDSVEELQADIEAALSAGSMEELQVGDPAETSRASIR